MATYTAPVSPVPDFIPYVLGNLPYRSLKRAGIEMDFHNQRSPVSGFYHLELRVRKDGITECCSSDVSERLLVSANPASLNDIIGSILKDMAREISPFVHEWDPRIGSSVTLHRGRVGNDNWPNCPLFDRKDGEDFAIFSKMRQGITHGLSCSSCKEPLVYPDVNHQVVAWAGGNVCWVHDKCTGGNFTGL